MLTKEQLTGSSLNKKITQVTAYGKLTEATNRFRKRTDREVEKRGEIENKIKPIYKPN